MKHRVVLADDGIPPLDHHFRHFFGIREGPGFEVDDVAVSEVMIGYEKGVGQLKTPPVSKA